MLIKGLFTVAITPFNPDGNLDAKGLRQNLRYQIDSGVDGITILGTTSETPTLTSTEKEQIIEIALEEVKGKVHLQIGTGSYSTAKTIEDTRLAKEAGADSVLIVTPYYNKPTQEGIYQHFKAIVESVDIPVMVYNIQSRSVQNIQTDTLQRIAQLPNIMGVKEASGQVSQMSDVLELIASKQPSFCVMCGDDALTFPLMTLGGHGILSVVSNLIPSTIRELVDALEQGNYTKARSIHFSIMPLIKAAFIETNPMPIKALMHLAGMPAGKCRLPLCDLLPANLEKVKNVLNDYQELIHPHAYHG